jgi:heme exporter protein D
MPGRAIPFYQTAQLRNLPADLREQATQKGLDQAFAMELFSLESNVKEALSRHDQTLAELALQQARDLQSAIKAAPDKSDGLLLR